jgi:hypothetical protein
MKRECAALYYSRLESAAFFQAAQTASERRAGADAHAPARCQVTQIDHMAAEPTHGPHHPCSSSSWLGARGPLLASGRSSTAEVFTTLLGFITVSAVRRGLNSWLRAARSMDDHLASVRARLSGLAQAAEVSALQVALAATVRERMERIDSIMGEPAASAAEDSEVEEWRRKIEALSKPVVVTRHDSPDHQPLMVEEEPEAAPSSQEMCRLVSTDATMQMPEPSVRAVWCCCA